MKDILKKQLTLFEEELNDQQSANQIEIDENYHKSLSPLKVTPVYDMYWHFAYRRQELFYKKLNGESELTQDPIIKKFKFTNAYRASDRVSQYLIRKVIYSSSCDYVDTFFRIILFKLFNKIETWEKLENEFGPIGFKDFKYKDFNNFLTNLIESKQRIYSAAYIMAPGKLEPGLTRKHSNHLKLIELMIEDDAPNKIRNAKKFRDVFEILVSYPMIGDFLGYQLAIDLNYSEIINFSEDDFVIPGPGALNGIAKCFISNGGLSNIEIIKFMKDRQEFEFKRLGLDFKSLWGRPLALIDCQNLFCETDKYARVAFPQISGRDKRKKIKQIYKPNERKLPSFWFPPKWGINERIN